VEIRKFAGKFPEVVTYLHRVGVLDGYPKQVNRTDLEYAEGIDIIFRFKKMGPQKFRHYVDPILLAACESAARYEDERWKFARFRVAMNRNKQGLKRLEPTWDYTAGKHSSSEVMVYGEEALGYETPGESKPYLINKAETILNIPDDVSTGPYVRHRNPYTVVSMTVCVRSESFSRMAALERYPREEKEEIHIDLREIEEKPE
jgi:hypothetical protein